MRLVLIFSLTFSVFANDDYALRNRLVASGAEIVAGVGLNYAALNQVDKNLVGILTKANFSATSTALTEYKSLLRQKGVLERKLKYTRKHNLQFETSKFFRDLQNIRRDIEKLRPFLVKNAYRAYKQGDIELKGYKAKKIFGALLFFYGAYSVIEAEVYMQDNPSFDLSPFGGQMVIEFIEEELLDE